MAEVKQGRWMAHIEGDFVVFLIGARFQKRHLVRTLRDLGGRRGMPYMLKTALARTRRAGCSATRCPRSAA